MFPAGRGGDWSVETLTEDAASDMTFADFDGDGEKEMLVMTPFHGDTVKIYKRVNGAYACVKTFEEKYEFAHGIWGTAACKNIKAVHKGQLYQCFDFPVILPLGRSKDNLGLLGQPEKALWAAEVSARIRE